MEGPLLTKTEGSTLATLHTPVVQYGKFALVFCAGFVVCLGIMLLATRNVSAPQGAGAEARLTQNISCDVAPVPAATSVQEATLPPAVKGSAPAWHLFGANAIDYGPLVPVQAADVYTGNFNDHRRYTVYDRFMDCFATVSYGGARMEATLTPATQYWSESNRKISGNLSLQMLRSLRLCDDRTGCKDGMVVMFTEDECSGTPLFDIGLGWTSDNGAPEVLLDYCFTTGLRAFKLVAQNKKFADVKVRSFCNFWPQPLDQPSVSGGQADRRRLCSMACQKVGMVNANPYWTEVVEVTAKLREMPTQPLTLRWL